MYDCFANIQFLLGQKSVLWQQRLSKSEPNEVWEEDHFIFDYGEPEWIYDYTKFKDHPFFKQYFNKEGKLHNTKDTAFPLLTFSNLERFCAEAYAKAEDEFYSKEGALYCLRGNNYSIDKSNEMVVGSPNRFFDVPEIDQMKLLVAQHWCMDDIWYEIKDMSKVVKALHEIKIEEYIPTYYEYRVLPDLDYNECPRFYNGWKTTDLVFYHKQHKLVFSVDYNIDHDDQYGFMRVTIYDSIWKGQSRGFYLIELDRYRALVDSIANGTL